MANNIELWGCHLPTHKIFVYHKKSPHQSDDFGCTCSRMSDPTKWTSVHSSLSLILDDLFSYVFLLTLSHHCQIEWSMMLSRSSVWKRANKFAFRLYSKHSKPILPPNISYPPSLTPSPLTLTCVCDYEDIYWQLLSDSCEGVGDDIHQLYCQFSSWCWNTPQNTSTFHSFGHYWSHQSMYMEFVLDFTWIVKKLCNWCRRWCLVWQLLKIAFERTCERRWSVRNTIGCLWRRNV